MDLLGMDPLCLQSESVCDANSGNCIISEKEMLGYVCDYESGLCEENVHTLCESEDTGACILYGGRMCPEGLLLNQEPLGCDAMCCLEAECLYREGYCTMWQEGCEEDYHQSADILGCPGGRSALCCLKGETPTCEENGGFCIGWAPVCPSGTDYDMTSVCEYGQCCMPSGSSNCVDAGGYCASENEFCWMGYEEENEARGCQQPNGLCCMPEQEECIPLGEIGMMFGNDVCCPGLSSSIFAEMTDDGECLLIDCSCFICLSKDDNYCDEINGEYSCNSEDCEESPQTCQNDLDCPSPQCMNLPTGAQRCSQTVNACLDGICKAKETTIENFACDEDSGICIDPSPSCADQDGYCAAWTSGCMEAYHIGEGDCGDMVCAGGCICCLKN